MTTPKKKNCNKCTVEYPYHGTEIGRINRAIGQMEAVKKMIDDRRYCPEIITLIRAARCAMKSVEANILEAFLGSCVINSFTSNNAKDKKQKISELKELFKRFEE
jgi:DNA-binding FrmR family transcriptional regulator